LSCSLTHGNAPRLSALLHGIISSQMRATAAPTHSGVVTVERRTAYWADASLKKLDSDGRSSAA
jgi:hypothetical protein